MRDSHLPPSGPEGTDGENGPGDGPSLSPDHLSPLGLPVLVTCLLVGFAAGWTWHALAGAVSTARPVGLLQALSLWFLGAGLGGLAVLTRRAVRRAGNTLDPQRMVNRLVLGRAGTLAGALLAGGHLGFGATWWTSHPDLRLERVGLAVLAATGGLVMLVCGKLLERACRVPPGPHHP